MFHLCCQVDEADCKFKYAFIVSAATKFGIAQSRKSMLQGFWIQKIHNRVNIYGNSDEQIKQFWKIRTPILQNIELEIKYSLRPTLDIVA